MGQGWRGMSMGEALLPAGMRICSFLGYKEIRRGEQSQDESLVITCPPPLPQHPHILSFLLGHHMSKVAASQSGKELSF